MWCDPNRYKLRRGREHVFVSEIQRIDISADTAILQRAGTAGTGGQEYRLCRGGPRLTLPRIVYPTKLRLQTVHRERVLSLVLPSRTVDLEASSVEMRDQWMEALQALLDARIFPEPANDATPAVA